MTTFQKYLARQLPYWIDRLNDPEQAVSAEYWIRLIRLKLAEGLE